MGPDDEDDFDPNADEADDADDDADAVDAPREPSPPTEPPLPPRTAVFGVMLAVAAFLPLAPDGRRFVDFVLEAFARSVLEGCLVLLGLGSPFLFGIATALASRVAPALGARLVRMPIAIMHSQLVLVAWAVWRQGDAIAALPFFGFSIVSGIYFALHLASARAGAGGPSLRWHIRWGSMLIIAIAAWARLQMFAGVFFGWALTLALLSATMLLRATRPEPVTD